MFFNFLTNPFRAKFEYFISVIPLQLLFLLANKYLPSYFFSLSLKL